MLRETAQTLDEDKDALADLSRHRFCSTNNLWFDLVALRDELDRRDGILGLAMIKNTKTVDPADPTSPEVIQIETAMGAAIEVFEGAALIEVQRDRFVPVKTTNDLLVLRSDCYELEDDARLRQAPSRCRSWTSTAPSTSSSPTSTGGSPRASRACGRRGR